MEHIVKDFGTDSSFADEHSKINKEEMVIDIILPLGS
jgi:hypothetical protein